MYNDVDVDLVNLFRCAGTGPWRCSGSWTSLPLHARADFEVVLRFLNHEYDPHGLHWRTSFRSQRTTSRPWTGRR